MAARKAEGKSSSSEEGASWAMAQNLHPHLQVVPLLCRKHPHTPTTRQQTSRIVALPPVSVSPKATRNGQARPGW